MAGERKIMKTTDKLCKDRGKTKIFGLNQLNQYKFSSCCVHFEKGVFGWPHRITLGYRYNPF